MNSMKNLYQKSGEERKKCDYVVKIFLVPVMYTICVILLKDSYKSEKSCYYKNIVRNKRKKHRFYKKDKN